MRILIKSQNSNLRYLEDQTPQTKQSFVLLLFVFFQTSYPPTRGVFPKDSCLPGAPPGWVLFPLSPGPLLVSTGRSDMVCVVDTLLMQKGLSLGKTMRNHKHFHETGSKFCSSDTVIMSKSKLNFYEMFVKLFLKQGQGGGVDNDKDNATASDF